MCRFSRDTTYSTPKSRSVRRTSTEDKILHVSKYAAPRMVASIVPAMTKHFILLSCRLIVKRNTVKRVDKKHAANSVSGLQSVLRRLLVVFLCHWSRTLLQASPMRMMRPLHPRALDNWVSDSSGAHKALGHTTTYS
jgi:hypothetical protein